ncbi:MAG: ATP-binding protein, partial [Sulfurimonas sp.]|nr:ATP-binding protein [Sulfurimonas sp.]
SAKESYISAALSKNRAEIKSLSSKIEGILGTIPNDVIYNANFYALEQLFVWEDLKDKRKTQHWKNIYTSSLNDYILNKKLYYQIRILDTKGKEKIVLKYNDKKDRVIQVVKNKLQDKSRRNYFKKSLKLQKGEFYISPMSLNIENGAIEKPFIPVVRYTTPIIDANGERKGIIILNLNAEYVLNLIATAYTADETKDLQNYYLLNEESFYLFHKDKSKRWGFQLGTDYNFKNDFAQVFEQFKDKESVTFREDGRIFSMQKIYPNKSENSYRFWYLVTEVHESVALQSLETFINIFFIILFSILIISVMLVNSYISKLMIPLSKVNSQLRALSKGEIQKEEIIYKSKDEIGQIVDSSKILVSAIETIINQANAVAQGDFSSKIKLLGKNDKLGSAISKMTKRLEEIASLAKRLSIGDYNTKVVVTNSDDKLGLALIDMIDYLESVTKLAEAIARGNIDIEYKSSGDKDRLGIAMLKMVSYLKNILHQANAISREDFSRTISPKSKQDELGLSLIKMTEILKSNAQKSKEEIFFSDGVGEFSDKLTGITNTIELSKEAISISCRYIKASTGVIYTFDKEKNILKLIASFSYIQRETLSNTFKLGEGIIGQVGLEQEPILLTNIRENLYEIQSGTTLTKPKEVYTFPLLYEGELLGVVEMMSLNGFSKLQQEYLLKVASILATSLHASEQNMQIKSLLEESKRAYQELQIQSKELQEKNVQMQEQQRQLTLQAEDMQKKNSELIKAKEDLDKRADDLEKASKYKSEFLANMSHELRTPLNSIILLSKLLTDNQDKTLGESDTAKTSVIHKAGNDLLLLINDILDLSKIESGNIDLNETDVSSIEIIEEMQGLFEEIAKEKMIDFKLKDNFKSTFIADKTKLLQIIKNLLSNAFKFTKSGSVSLEFFQKENEIFIRVNDTGIGIAQEKLTLIFEAFKQVDGSISREYGGTGLGLSISKTFIDLMQGSIDVKSQEGKGSTFTIRLPLRKGTEIKEEQAQYRGVSSENFSIIKKEESSKPFDSEFLQGKNIFIIDDDSRNIFTLSSIIEELGAETYNAVNTKEAFKFLENNNVNIDIILMNLIMPLADGLKAIELIKSDKKFKHIPMITLISEGMEEDKERYYEAGVNDFLQKPIDQNTLISILKTWSK